PTVTPRRAIAAQATASISPRRLAPPSGMESSQVDLAGEQGRGGVNAVQDQGSVEVVQLVLEGPGLEPIHGQSSALPRRVRAGYGHPEGSPDVRGEVGNRQAPLPGHLRPLGIEDLRIEQ